MLKVELRSRKVHSVSFVVRS